MLHSSNEITVYMAFFISLNITSTSSPPATSLKDIMEQEQNKESPDIRTTSEVGTSWFPNYALTALQIFPPSLFSFIDHYHY